MPNLRRILSDCFGHCCESNRKKPSPSTTEKALCTALPHSTQDSPSALPFALEVEKGAWNGIVVRMIGNEDSMASQPSVARFPVSASSSCSMGYSMREPEDDDSAGKRSPSLRQLDVESCSSSSSYSLQQQQQEALASDQILLESLDTRRQRPLVTGRFLTLHKRRKKRPPTRALHADMALLDDLYHGPTKVLLDQVGEWPFDAFVLDRVTGGRSLPVLCFHLFHRHGLMRHFRLDPVKVWKFFTLVEEGYHGNNPYHNAIHATDVTQAMHCFLLEDKIRRYLSPLEAMASLIAAVAHDLDHPGVNQPFLVATSNHLAALYKNASVLENHHWRSAIGCLRQSGLGSCFEPSDLAVLEEQIQSLILATDIARQQEFLSTLKTHLDCGNLELSHSRHRHFMLQIALKCADICNPCRPWDVSQAWSLQVSEEFYRQGDLERHLGLPITTMCDREQSSVSKIQSGFFRFIASPLFEEWHRFQKTTLSTTMVFHLRSNQAKWDSILEQEMAQSSLLRNPVPLTPAPSTETLESADLEPNNTNSTTGLAIFATSTLSAATDKGQRRHSVQFEPDQGHVIARTVIRRESLPTAHFLQRLPTNVTVHMRSELGSELTVRQTWNGTSGSPTRTLSAEDILPDPSITYMTPLMGKKTAAAVASPTTSTPTTTTAAPTQVEKRPEEKNTSLGSANPSRSPPSAEKSTTTGTETFHQCQNLAGRRAKVVEEEDVDAEPNLNTEDKENIRKNVSPHHPALTSRRGSAPNASSIHLLLSKLFPHGSESTRCHRRHPFARQGSLRLPSNRDHEHVSPKLMRRGSLPYELDRKNQLNSSEKRSSAKPVTAINPAISIEECFSSKTSPRRGSAPSDLWIGPGPVPCWLVLREKNSGKDGHCVSTTTSPPTPSVGDCGTNSSNCFRRERRRHSLRRRRSGGPELFSSVARRTSLIHPNAQLPPLPQSSSLTCTSTPSGVSSNVSPTSLNYATLSSQMKLKRNSSPSNVTLPNNSVEYRASVKRVSIDSNDSSCVEREDWVDDIRRRNSGNTDVFNVGAATTTVGVWKYDEEQDDFPPVGRPTFRLPRGSQDSSTSSVDEWAALLPPQLLARRPVRRGSLPADPVRFLASGENSPVWELCRR